MAQCPMVLIKVTLPAQATALPGRVLLPMVGPYAANETPDNRAALLLSVTGSRVVSVAVGALNLKIQAFLMTCSILQV